jgi:nicotinamidase-related amidase
MPVSAEELKQLETIGEKAEYARKAGLKVKGGSLLLIIDMQNDFMEGGALPVSGARADAKRLADWMVKNAGMFSEVIATMDTHGLSHVFFPGWWEDAEGETVKPFTEITKKDFDKGLYRPRFHRAATAAYIAGLEALGRYTLMVWPYHCVANTAGHGLEENIFNALCFYEASGGRVTRVFKGMDPLSEMYGVFACEYPEKRRANRALLRRAAAYGTVYIAGEAKSHCVLSTLRQLAAYMEEQGKSLSAIRVLNDCMSAIAGFEEATEREFNAFKEKGVVFTAAVDNESISRSF